jgi:hypothetical protein
MQMFFRFLHYLVCSLELAASSRDIHHRPDVSCGEHVIVHSVSQG